MSICETRISFGRIFGVSVSGMLLSDALRIYLNFFFFYRAMFIFGQRSLLMVHLNVLSHRPCKKPLSPSCSVQMAGTQDSPVPVPLLAAALGTDTRTVLLAYGNHLQPVMERVVSDVELLSTDEGCSHLCTYMCFSQREWICLLIQYWHLIKSY